MRLTRGDVICTALALLDEVGLDALTMRRLAERLGVRAGALYWHVANKQALIEAMADAMLEGIVPQAAPAGWRADLAGLMAAVRQALLARRDGARVFAGTYVAEANTLALGERVIGALRDAGFSDRDSVWGSWTLLYFTIGLTLEEQAAGSLSPAGLTRAVSPDRTPHLAAVMPHLADRDFGARFAFGLDLVLDGLAARL